MTRDPRKCSNDPQNRAAPVTLSRLPRAWRPASLAPHHPLFLAISRARQTRSRFLEHCKRVEDLVPLRASNTRPSHYELANPYLHRVVPNWIALCTALFFFEVQLQNLGWRCCRLHPASLLIPY
jgi:hypothetical protein